VFRVGLRRVTSNDSPAGYPYRKNVNGDQRHGAGARVSPRLWFQLVAKLVRKIPAGLGKKIRA